MNFKQFLEHNPLKIYGSFTTNPNGPGNTVGTHNDGNSGAFLSTSWSGSESGTMSPFTLPGIDLVKIKNIESIKDNSKIESVDGDLPRPGKQPKNPIKITLENGRKIFMTFDEFNRAGGGKRIKKGASLVWTLFPKGDFYQVQNIT